MDPKDIPDEDMEYSIWEKMDNAASKVVADIATKALENTLKNGKDIEIPSLGITIKHEDYDRSSK